MDVLDSNGFGEVELEEVIHNARYTGLSKRLQANLLSINRLPREIFMFHGAIFEFSPFSDSDAEDSGSEAGTNGVFVLA